MDECTVLIHVDTYRYMYYICAIHETLSMPLKFGTCMQRVANEHKTLTSSY